VADELNIYATNSTQLSRKMRNRPTYHNSVRKTRKNDVRDDSLRDAKRSSVSLKLISVSFMQPTVIDTSEMARLFWDHTVQIASD